MIYQFVREGDRMICCIPMPYGIFKRTRQSRLSICVGLVCLASCSIATAQSGIRTEATQQTQFYGKWNHPVESANTTTSQPTSTLDSDQFRKLFPPAPSKPFENHPSVVAGPPAIAQTPLRSRPLQPLPEPMLRGEFREPGFSDSAVASFESTPVVDSAINKSMELAPQLENQADAIKDKAAGMMDWISEKGQSALGGVPAKSKNLLSRISGFFGGQDNPVRKVLGALALLIGSYLGFVWLARKFNFANDGRIPAEVIEVLGVSPFGPRKNLQLVRLGSKLLLLMNGPEGTHPVGEITDPSEVEHLASLCKGRSTRPTDGMLSVIRNHTKMEQPSIGQTSIGQTSIGQPTQSFSGRSSREQSFSASQLMQALENLQGHNSTRSYEA